MAEHVLFVKGAFKLSSEAYFEGLGDLVSQLTLRVQVPKNHILTPHLLYYNYYYPKPEYLIIGYMDPLGK